MQSLYADSAGRVCMQGELKNLESGITGGRPMCVRGQGMALYVANVWRRGVRKLFRARKEKVSLSANNGKTNYAIPSDTCSLRGGAELIFHSSQ